jgi:hypothetical protein
MWHNRRTVLQGGLFSTLLEEMVTENQGGQRRGRLKPEALQQLQRCMELD